MPYHVRITQKSSIDEDEIKLDLTEELIIRRFVKPYEKGTHIIISGKTIVPEDIERIRINFTQESSKELLPVIQRERAKSSVATPMSGEWYVTNRGDDVTDDYIKGPPGKKSESNQQNLQAVDNYDSLVFPDNVTFSWLKDHVPVKIWLAFGGALIAVFIFGVTAGQIDWVRQLLGKEGSYANMPNAKETKLPSNKGFLLQIILSTQEEKLLSILYKYQKDFGLDKMIVGRDGTLYFNDKTNTEKHGINIIGDLYNINKDYSVKESEFEKLMLSIPDTYLKTIPEMFACNPFVVRVTRSGIAYLKQD